ncbi:MAG: hypothetical protein AAF581_13100 [Planctomycetota bacterium]
MTARGHQSWRRRLAKLRVLAPRRGRNQLRRWYRRFVFRGAMRLFLRRPELALDCEHTLLRDLVYGWDNVEWSAREDYLRCCLQDALQTQEPILECGSGLSTLLVGALAQQRGVSVESLEHVPEWAERVCRLLARNGISGVRLNLAPLVDHGEYCWYSVPEQLPKKFGLVICDGPPGATKGGRYGLVPVLRTHLAPGCIVLLDDANRVEEQAIAKRWSDELGATSERLGTQRAYIRLKLPTT